MSNTTRWPLAKAAAYARSLVSYISPYCERIEVAGSIRRRRPDVGDVELVLIPRLKARISGQQMRMFGDPIPTKPHSLTWEVLDQLFGAPEKGGDRYRCYPAVEKRPQVDIFAVLPPAQWGPMYCLRTGPAAFSKDCVIRLRKRGMRQEAGRVMKGEQVVDCPEELDFLRACGLPWIAPEDRR